MIGIAIIFLGGIFTLFTGLNRVEQWSKNVSSVLLLLASLFSWLEYKGILNFQNLFKWVPQQMLDISSTTEWMSALLLFLGFIIMVIMPANSRKGADVPSLMLFSLSGGILLMGAEHLVMLFLGLEILSIPLFVLAGSDKENLASNEAALKYFIMGAFSTAVLLLGAAFIYGGTGTLNLNEIQLKLSFAAHFGEFPILLKAGLILVSIGLLFKVSAVPFHFWSPDVYEGSPNRISVFMAVIVKISGFYALGNIFNSFSPMVTWSEQWIIPILGLTIIGGNIMAIGQTKVKRMLAYSSISHAGYLLLFILTPFEENINVLATYSLSYGLGTISLFYLMDYYSKQDNEFSMFKALFAKNKLHGFMLVIATLSIAGVPSTIGFVAKYQLFSTAFVYNQWAVIIALFGSAMSIAYYFKPFKYAFDNSQLKADQKSSKIELNFNSICIVGLIAITMIIGIFPAIMQSLL